MNTILITGTAITGASITDQILYDVNIWGSLEGEALQFVKPLKINRKNYGHLWGTVKDICVSYFKSPKMCDGAYTQFLDHLYIKHETTEKSKNEI